MSDRIIIKRTVFFDNSTGEYCMCQGGFWKSCPLRMANDLTCIESIVSLTPVDRDEDLGVDQAVKVLDKSLKNLQSSIRKLNKKGFKVL
jgi:hypothetical protein